jgi:hypothetical protein
MSFRVNSWLLLARKPNHKFTQKTRPKPHESVRHFAGSDELMGAFSRDFTPPSAPLNAHERNIQMKLSYLIILAAALLSACSQAQSTSNTNRTANVAAPASSANSSPAAGLQSTSSAPVEFTYTGMTADKTSAAYKIKVNTDKPIDEVHLTLKETDAHGKVVEDTIVIWANIVGSTRHPIETGKTYEDQTALDPAATKADVSLKEVTFKDGTRWSPSGFAEK